jgi:hypothetical protein
MHRHLKLLTTSLIMALSLAPTRCIGMDLDDVAGKSIKRTATDAELDAIPQAKKNQKMINITESSFGDMHSDVQGEILLSCIAPYAESVSQGKMSYKDFLSEVVVWTYRLFGPAPNEKDAKRKSDDYNAIQRAYIAAFSHAYDVDEIDHKDCLTFLNGKLFFMKDTANAQVLKIADQLNPFRCQFDLSKCIHPQWGSMDGYLRIGTGYRDDNQEKMSKTDINIIPLFWIKKELLQGRAQHLLPMYMDENSNWKPNAPIGIYMAYGRDNHDQFACITTLDCTSLSSKSIWEIFCSAHCTVRLRMQFTCTTSRQSRIDHSLFMSFCELK